MRRSLVALVLVAAVGLAGTALAAIALRNTETLRRLAYMAEGRTDPRGTGDQATAGSTDSLSESKIHRDGDG